MNMGRIVKEEEEIRTEEEEQKIYWERILEGDKI
jgi:hypothetical protein